MLTLYAGDCQPPTDSNVSVLTTLCDNRCFNHQVLSTLLYEYELFRSVLLDIITTEGGKTKTGYYYLHHRRSDPRDQCAPFLPVRHGCSNIPASRTNIKGVNRNMAMIQRGSDDHNTAIRHDCIANLTLYCHGRFLRFSTCVNLRVVGTTSPTPSLELLLDLESEDDGDEKAPSLLSLMYPQEDREDSDEFNESGRDMKQQRGGAGIVWIVWLQPSSRSAAVCCSGRGARSEYFCFIISNMLCAVEAKTARHIEHLPPNLSFLRHILNVPRTTLNYIPIVLDVKHCPSAMYCPSLQRFRGRQWTERTTVNKSVLPGDIQNTTLRSNMVRLLAKERLNQLLYRQVGD